MRISRLALLAAFALSLSYSGAARAEAQNITKAVQDACEWEYDKFCNQYGLGSELLNMCFKQNASQLTKACVDALVAAGDVSEEYVQQQKKLLGR
jgi:hypothetical protein